MPKIRKVKRRQKFRTNVNRKRLKNRQRRPSKLRCDILKTSWNRYRTAEDNLTEMGLVYDLNKDIKKSKIKEKIMSDISATTKWKTEFTVPITPSAPTKAFVVEELEKDANAPRERTFRLPNSQVEWLTKLMDKYGMDYKAMVKDETNYYQKTWKQIRAKIRIFKKIPEQYGAYLKQRGLTEDKMKEMDIDSD